MPSTFINTVHEAESPTFNDSITIMTSRLCKKDALIDRTADHKLRRDFRLDALTWCILQQPTRQSSAESSNLTATSQRRILTLSQLLQWTWQRNEIRLKNAPQNAPQRPGRYPTCECSWRISERCNGYAPFPSSLWRSPSNGNGLHVYNVRQDVGLMTTAILRTTVTAGPALSITPMYHDTPLLPQKHWQASRVRRRR